MYPYILERGHFPYRGHRVTSATVLGSWHSGRSIRRFAVIQYSDQHSLPLYLSLSSLNLYTVS